MSSQSPSRLFRPIIAGATLRERLLSCLGALFGMGLASVLTRMAMGGSWPDPLIVGPVAASAVLVFAVPTSPLAQPWPVLGGNIVGGFSGLILAFLLGPLQWSPPLVAALAVPVAILAMSLARCLHPPGGAMALSMALMVQEGGLSSWLTPMAPVLLNIAVLLAVAALFHRVTGRNYPHRAATAPVNAHGSKDPPANIRNAFDPADVDAALAALDESFDIDRDDLFRLVQQADLAAIARSGPHIDCARIMSRDIFSVSPETDVVAAREMLLAHNIRALPVLDGSKRVVGIIGLREISASPDNATVGAIMSKATTVTADEPVAALLPLLADGKAHAAVVVDAGYTAIGLVTQTDLLWAMARAAQK